MKLLPRTMSTQVPGVTIFIRSSVGLIFLTQGVRGGTLPLMSSQTCLGINSWSDIGLA